MSENDTKNCPYCAEPVRVQASVCRYCRSSLASPKAPDAYRNHPGRQIAGVSIAMAEAFGISVTFVRLAFIVLTFISFIGPPLYLVLWLLLPAEPGGLSPLGRVVVGENGEPSILERTIHAAEDVFDRVAAWFRGKTPPDTPNGPARPDGPARPHGNDEMDGPAERAS
ncbi:MAG: hypothetical protein BMS9Abin37_0776 [Acidobacteriota bacterium]|nr:MAG: hypothetical protein BMS9Abin37_0776 [Acidobacteriota bacterium]